MQASMEDKQASIRQLLGVGVDSGYMRRCVVPERRLSQHENRG
jgi:hypothetical protein